MNSRTKRKTGMYIAIAISYIILFSFLSLPVTADLDWGDNFDDGNHNGWTVHEGIFDASAGYLNATMGFAVIYRPSTRLTGTWLFDIYEDHDKEPFTEVLFISTGLESTDFVGYSLRVFYDISYDAVNLMRWNYSATYDRSAAFGIAQHILTDEPAGWHSYNVTRNGAGDLIISRDGSLIIETSPDPDEWEFDTQVASSDNFLIRCEVWAAIDNVYVGEDYSIETTSATGTTSTTVTSTESPSVPSGDSILGIELVVVVFVGVAVVIILAVVCVRKR